MPPGKDWREITVKPVGEIKTLLSTPGTITFFGKTKTKKHYIASVRMFLRVAF